MQLSPCRPTRNKLFQTLSILPVLVISGIMVCATNTALADPRHRDNNSRFNTSFDSSWNRDFRGHINQPVPRYNSRFDRHSNRGVNHSFNRNFRRNDYTDNRFRNFGTPNRYRTSRYDGWSVSLNLGSGYSSTRYGSGVYSGIGSYYYGSGLLGNPYGPYRNRTSVIYSQPTVVYVNDYPRVTGQVSERRRTVSPARSLLRDIHGDCYERTYDSRGHETRIRLPDSACHF